jgi:hypothetical protein
MSSLSILAKQDKPNRDDYHKNKTNPELTAEQTKSAMEELCVSQGLKKFPSFERYITDPPFRQQVFCLHSFIPSKGAKPDKDGVYGWVKCRGTFNTEAEMDERAEEIIRTFDSFHHLFHGRVGVPFPFSLDPKYVEDTVEINLKEKAKKDVQQDMKRIRDEDQRTIKEIKDRERMLLEDTKKESPDDIDDYITKRVKRATLIYTIVETRKKLNEMIKSLENVEKVVNELDESNPKLREQCVDKYNESRREAGLSIQDSQKDRNMVYYIMEDLPEGVLNPV